MAPTAVRVQLTPITLEADGCLVHVLEVLKNLDLQGRPLYHVALKLKCGALESKVFNLTVRDTRELKAKILAEIAKLKLVRFLHGDEFAGRVVG